MSTRQITATFIDEISVDIPSANWGPAEWSKDFDVMRAIGIDTVVMIRSGYKDHATFNSKALGSIGMRPCYFDLPDMFLNEAERCGMKFFCGTYDSGRYWREGQPEREIEINLRLTEELVERYGSRKAFQGWYISQEIDVYSDDAIKVYERLSTHLKSLKNCPILISPYIHGIKCHEDALSPDDHEKDWSKVFERIEGIVDIVAFQDGHCEFNELTEFLEINAGLCKKHGITCWSNVETFERGMPISFLPIAWPNLRFKMEAAEATGVEKLITFEFSHFMSPNSPYQSAHNLYNRYLEWMDELEKKSS